LRTINIPFPDITYMEKSRLVTKIAKDTLIPKDSSRIYVRNPTGISAGDFLVLEAFESDNAEIVQVTHVDTIYHALDLVTPTLLDHLSGVIILSTPFDMVKVYIGTSADITTHVDLSTNLLRPDSAYTYVIDQTGTSLDYYSYRYFNSQTGYVGTHTLYTVCIYDAVLTVDNLKRWFMFGLDLTDDDGYPFPMSMFEFAIRAAVDNLEKVIQVKLKPTTVLDERHDYFRNDYIDFAYIQLNNWPVISVERIALKYPTAQAEISFPIEWAQLRKTRGQIHLIPTTGSLSQIMIGTGGDYLNFVWRGMDFMPDLWRIDYTAGFGTGLCPNDVVGIVGKLACFYPLNLAGDLVGGIAIASKSIGIDGLSQSVNTTSCLHPDVLVLANNEYRKISEVGSPTILWDGNLKKIFVDNIETPLMITPNHLILTNNGWKRSETISIFDKIDQGNGKFKSISCIDDFYFKGQLYDLLNQPEQRFKTITGIVHNSPENAGYSARLRQYEKELKLEIPRLVAYYKSFRMAVC